MTPDEIIAEFEQASGLVVHLMKAHRGEPVKPLFIEAKMRVEQSTMLLKDFRKAELQYSSPNGSPAAFHEAGTRMRLYGEAFYYFAWRAHKALAKCGVKFTPEGVRLVRNRMIEHPDKHDGIPILCWMTDCPQGLVLEPQGSELVPGSDPGLYPNAQEYIAKLLPGLKHAIAGGSGAAETTPPSDDP